MILKSFVLKVGENTDFIDSKDRDAYWRLVSSMREKGIKKFRILIETIDESPFINENQKTLFKVLVGKISDISGNDRDTIEQTLVENLLTNKDWKKLSHTEFNDFLEKIVVFCNEFFNLNIDYNEANGHFEIKKIR